MNKYPRAIYFKSGKAVGTSTTMANKGFDHYDSLCVMHLPSEHYDFMGPVKIFGQTKEEIESEIEAVIKSQE